MRVRYRILESHFDSETYLNEIKRAGERARLDDRRYGWNRRGRGIAGILRNIAVDRRDGTAYDGGAKSMAARSIEGLIDTPKAVEAHDGEAELAEVRAMVRDGELHLRDLVDVGRGWQCVQECGELYDLVADAEVEAQSQSTGWRVIGVLFVVMLFALAFAMCGT